MITLATVNVLFEHKKMWTMFTQHSPFIEFVTTLNGVNI